MERGHPVVPLASSKSGKSGNSNLHPTISASHSDMSDDDDEAPTRAQSIARPTLSKYKTLPDLSHNTLLPELVKSGNEGLRLRPLGVLKAAGCRVGVDSDAMKAQVRENLLRPAYDVRKFYKSTGVWQGIARSAIFEHITLFVIALNALWIWIDTDFNSSEVLVEALPVFQVVEHSFIVFFSFEWTVRFLSFKRKRQCLKDAWFVFDSCLVLMMVLEGWLMSGLMLVVGQGASGSMGNASILRMARLLRLSRMARMVRLFRAMPELLILLKGMAAATRSVFFTLCLLMIVLYVFGIAFRQLTDSTAVGDKYFSSVVKSMYTLLIDGTFMDSLGPLVRAVGQESPALAMLFWLFVLMSAMTVMNMLIGVLCEVVSAVAATEKEALAINFVKERMRDLFTLIGKSDGGLISKEEFLKIVQKPEACRVLEETGVDVLGIIDMADTIFSENNESGEPEDKPLGFTELMELILDLRGSNTAKVRHIVDLRRHSIRATSQTNKAIAKLEVRVLARLEKIERGQRHHSAKGTSSTTLPKKAMNPSAYLSGNAMLAHIEGHLPKGFSSTSTQSVGDRDFSSDRMSLSSYDSGWADLNSPVPSASDGPFGVLGAASPVAQAAALTKGRSTDQMKKADSSASVGGPGATVAAAAGAVASPEALPASVGVGSRRVAVADFGSLTRSLEAILEEARLDLCKEFTSYQPASLSAPCSPVCGRRCGEASPTRSQTALVEASGGNSLKNSSSATLAAGVPLPPTSTQSPMQSSSADPVEVVKQQQQQQQQQQPVQQNEGYFSTATTASTTTGGPSRSTSMPRGALQIPDDVSLKELERQVQSSMHLLGALEELRSFRTRFRQGCGSNPIAIVG
mmetsp:Transcript_79533/g.165157  ORF Transcript_79533/g.165157 Transcript_79533/m.165157 type:complete len:858 (+) Transcript_79533:102-2675(+)